MIAASALVVAVLASYAGIGMLSLTGSGTLSPIVDLPIVNAVVKGIGWNPPKVGDFTHVGSQSASGAASAPLADTSLISLYSTPTSPAPPQQVLSLQNASTSAVEYTVSISGPGAPGVSAAFTSSGAQKTRTVRPGAKVPVYVSSSDLYAGPIEGSLVISASGFGSKTIPIQGIQAPAPPGAVTATPAKSGAVELSWAPSASVSGVNHYVVERSTDSATWTQVATTPDASTTTAVDQTPSDATYSYRVMAVSDGAPGVDSSASPVATATSDSTPPSSPQSVSGPQWINIATAGQVQITVQPAVNAQPTDTITVTLTGPAGGTVSSQPTPVGTGGPITVSVDARNLGDGSITASATESDSLGNPSQPTSDSTQTITKDTMAPVDPGPLSELQTITQQNESSYSIQVEGPTAWAPTSTIHAQFTDVNGKSVSATASGSAGTVQMTGLGSLADGPITVLVWVTDAAGNSSDQVSGSANKRATPPTAPTVFGIAAGPDNPANVVTPKSAHDVYITATFAQAPTADVNIKVFAHNQTLVDQQGDGQTTTFTFGPFDFSGVDPGVHHVNMMLTDSVGNETWDSQPYTVDNGVQGPTSVGVPAGPNNPAGYVNAATQTAATIVATFAAPTDPADQIALSVGGLSLGEQAGGSDTVSWTGDLSSLPDGTLQILGTITDPNGVQSTFSGSLIKDTTPPPAPAVAAVVGPPPNTITPGHASCVNVGVAFNHAPDPSDTVQVTLSDGTTSVQGSAPAGNGQVTVGCIDASSLANGPVSVTVTVTDVAGNSVTFTGTPAVKMACQPNGAPNSQQG